jgi:hypothetical protein
MFTNTQLLSKKHLSARLIPLRWPRYGGTPQPLSDRAAEREEVDDLVRAGLSPFQRARNWIKANPLVFGLPGGRYIETVRLDLEPSNDLQESRISLVPERDVIQRFQKAETIDQWEEGTLYARAGNSSLGFYAVLGPGGKVGRMTPQRIYGKRQGCEVERLTQGQRLIYETSNKDRKEGHVAGWVLE